MNYSKNKNFLNKIQFYHFNIIHNILFIETNLIKKNFLCKIRKKEN